MRTLLLTALAVATNFIGVQAFEPLEPRAQCSSNPCLQAAIAGHKKHGHGQCGAFFKQTIIPATVTEKSTTTIHTGAAKTTVVTNTHFSTTYAKTHTVVLLTTLFTSTATATQDTATETETLKFNVPGRFAKRSKVAKATTTSLTTVPSVLATICKNTAQYSSACSCVGATHKTITLATPTAINTISQFVTDTTTSTSFVNITSTVQNEGTLTISATSTMTTIAATTIDGIAHATTYAGGEFLLLVSSEQSPKDGEYLQMADDGSSCGFASDAASGTNWFVNKNGMWHSDSGMFAMMDHTGKPQKAGYEGVYFLQDSNLIRPYYHCDVDETNSTFSCQAWKSAETVFSECAGSLDFGNKVPNGCNPVSLTAVYIGHEGYGSSSGYTGFSSSSSSSSSSSPGDGSGSSSTPPSGGSGGNSPPSDSSSSSPSGSSSWPPWGWSSSSSDPPPPPPPPSSSSPSSSSECEWDFCCIFDWLC